MTDIINTTLFHQYSIHIYLANIFLNIPEASNITAPLFTSSLVKLIFLFITITVNNDILPAPFFNSKLSGYVWRSSDVQALDDVSRSCLEHN